MRSGERAVMRPRGGGAAEVPMCRACRDKMESQEKMLKRNTEKVEKQAARWAPHGRLARPSSAQPVCACVCATQPVSVAVGQRSGQCSSGRSRSRQGRGRWGDQKAESRHVREETRRDHTKTCNTNCLEVEDANQRAKDEALPRPLRLRHPTSKPRFKFLWF